MDMKISRRTVVKGMGAVIATAAIPVTGSAAANHAVNSDKFTVPACLPSSKTPQTILQL